MRRLLLVLTMPLLGACELDFTGIGDALAEGFCGGPCLEPVPALLVGGRVWVGSYLADEKEVTILLYAASDTVMPVDSIFVYYRGQYFQSFGTAPAPAVCEYVARAVLWTGEVTGLVPLLPRASDCEPSLATRPGPTFHLPAYPPLDTSFAVWGRVTVDGRPASSGEVTLLVPRRSAEGYVDQSITTSDDGTWRLDAIDRAQRYSMCRRVWAFVRPETQQIEHETFLDLPAGGACGNDRQLPDVRIGTRRAAVGHVVEGASPELAEPVGAGAATVTLLWPADSSAVGETYSTFDDGSFHIWFAHAMSDPGCDWLLRAELGSQVQILPLLPAGATECSPSVYRRFEFTAG